MGQEVLCTASCWDLRAGRDAPGITAAGIAPLHLCVLGRQFVVTSVIQKCSC